jgi:uncharacterized protein YfaS (alpha-2-macroglobulin family)
MAQRLVDVSAFRALGLALLALSLSTSLLSLPQTAAATAAAGDQSADAAIESGQDGADPEGGVEASPHVRPGTAQPSDAGQRQLVIIRGADYFGHDYDTLQDVGLDECEASCLADARCRAFTFNSNAGWCFLKSSLGDLRAFDGAISGYIQAGSVDAADQRALRRSELAFLPSSYRDEADVQRRRIAAAKSPGGAGGGIDELLGRAQQALTEKDPRTAALNYRIALRLAPDDPGLWRRLSEAAMAVQSNDWSERQQVQQEATAAAINTYLRASTVAERARALALIGRSLELRSAWRPAIRAERASLALIDDPALRSRLDRLVAEHGFRIIGHEVSSDARNPRICIRFSDPLARDGVELADYLELDVPGLAIEPEAEQLCIDGVEHGGRYRIRVRAGLPANDGERLAKAVALEVYVRDRAPSVRFPGRAYVLPSGGSAALPVVTVNTSRLDAALYRVGDRALGGFLNDETLLTPLSPYQIEEIAETTGEQLWQGQIETRSELNREVTTSVPVAELLARMRGGQREGAHADAGHSGHASDTTAGQHAVRSAGQSEQGGANRRSGRLDEFGDGSSGALAELASRASTGAAFQRLSLRPGAYILTARPADALENDDLATQWFVVSDLGLTALSADDGLHAFVRSLSSAEPLADARLQLLAMNQLVLGEARTDAQGYARFEPGLLRGEGGNRPALLIAESPGAGVSANAGAGEAADEGAGADQGTVANAGVEASLDYGFLDLKASPFDLSDRGVSGRAPAQPIDTYLVSERGIYRPGETVVLTALTRDPRAHAVTGVPLTFVLKRPDGVEQQRELVADQGFGGYQLRLPLLNDAMRGTWQAEVYADPKAEALARAGFLVEDFEPERLDFSVASSAPMLDPSAPPSLSIAARFLYGVPAANLEVSGMIQVTLADGLTDWPGWRFGLASEEVADRSEPLPNAETDAAGQARLRVELPTPVPSTRPLQAKIDVQVLDGGGRPVERNLSLPVLDQRPRIGIKPLFEGAVDQGSNARFQVRVLDANGVPMPATGLRWTLSQVQTAYQWYRTDGDWRFEPVVSRTRVASGDLDVGPDPNALAQLEAPVDWGAYELRIEASADSALVPASIGFEAGWYVAPKAFDTPDVLKVSLDKAEYRIGEQAQVRLEPRFPGLALVMVIGGDGLVGMHPAQVPKTGASVALPVTADWGPGAYVTAILYRGMDLQTRRMPRRAIGLHWAGVDPERRRLRLALETPELARPREPLNIAVQIDDWAPGEEAFVTLAAVDVGILNLTRFQPWSPSRWYFGQRRLGAELRDLYGQLIDRMQGEPGRLRTGSGTGQLMSFEGPPPSEALVAFQTKPLRLDVDGRAQVSFDLPDFSGQVRVMAMAWSAAGIGQAAADVLVRDPIVVSAAMPRFLAPGDHSRILLELAHIEGPAGPVEVSLTSNGNGLRIDNDGTPMLLDLPEQGRAQLTFPVQALSQDPTQNRVEDQRQGQRQAREQRQHQWHGQRLGQDRDQDQRQRVGPHLISGAGMASSTRAARQTEILVRLVTPTGDVLTKELLLGVRSLEPAISQTQAIPLEPGAPPLRLQTLLAEDNDLFAGTASWSLSISGAGALDVPGILWSLDRYPFGCVEQLTSRALPLLYLDAVALGAGLPPGRNAVAGDSSVSAGVDSGARAVADTDTHAGDDVSADPGTTLDTNALTSPGSANNRAAVPARIGKAIAEILAHQHSTGGFGLWQPGLGDLWLDAYVTDFLTRAREQGYAVQATAFSNALENLRNQLSYAADFDKGGEGIAYALYVLARNGRVPVGDLRYYLETKLDAFATPMARAQLGAALALFGETERAATALRSAQALWEQQTATAGWRADFGSHLRDGAALLTFAAESGSSAIAISALGGQLERLWAATDYPSTQDQAWMLLAAHALMDGAAKPRLSVNGRPQDGAFFQRGRLVDLASEPSAARPAPATQLELANAGDRPLTAMLTRNGIPVRPAPAGGNGYSIERSYYDLDGRGVDPTQINQGARLVALITVSADQRRAARLIINDPLPAGLEIDNPHLLRSGSIDGLPWLNLVTEPVHLAFGSERFVAAVDRKRNDPSSFQLAYVVRAISPGRFAHPAAQVEAMYQPNLRARTASGILAVRAPE